MIGLVSLALALTFFALGMERLATFSNTMLVWADAKRLAETKPLELGSDRIFYNFGRNLYLNDYIEESEKNVRIALQINPDFQQAHGLLGALFIRQKMWQEAIEQYTVAREIETKLNLGHTSVYLIGRARAYEGSGNGPLAIQDYLEACRINPNFCETLRKSAKPID
jgi:tetratricopeptide (TPR) repeat protein